MEMRWLHEKIEYYRRKLFDKNEQVSFDGSKFTKLKGAEPPNQSSKLLIDWAVDRINKTNMQPKSLYDICCGIGIIGLTMSKRVPSLEYIYYSDINPRNISSLLLNGSKLIVDRCSISDGVKNVYNNQKFDIIISNPPHFLTGEAKDIAQVDSDLKFHKEFYASAHEYLNPNGEVWFLETNQEIPVDAIKSIVETNKKLKWLGIEKLDYRYYYISMVGLTPRRKKSDAQVAP